MTSKQELREIIRATRRQQCSDNTTLSDISRINTQLLELLTANSVILAFYPLNDEVDITPLLHALIGEQKTVLLPAIVSPTEMILREYTGDDDLQRGPLGTMEPTGRAFSSYDKIGAALIPGVAFTPQGRRLGRGKGYYDRLLPLLRNAYKIGVCFPYQVVKHIPCEAHDIPVDYVQS